MGITFIDLFAGIGGFRRGMELAGHTCIGMCEFDKYAVMSYTMMHLATDEQRLHIQGIAAPVQKNGEPNLRKRQKEILKEENRNGEWYADDIRRVDARSMPKADCWCFGAPCQDFSVAGNRAGLEGDRSSLVREVFKILGEIEEKSRPEWIIYENVKGMLSSNKGFDFLEILLAMDELGYDCEWQLFNSKDWGVPQNRERVYTIGHFRRCGSRKILPIGKTDTVHNSAKENEQIYEVAQCLTAGGNDKWQGDYIVKQRGSNSSVPGVAIREATKKGYAIAEEGDSVNLAVPGSKTRRGRVGKGVANTLDTSCNQGIVNSDLVIRRLTPKECFRLQGWSDDYFEKAAFVNSDSQLYKQAGNGVTVNVVQAIAEKLN